MTSLREARPPVRVIEILGPAGSGKTTLVRALTRQHPPLVTGIRLSKLALAPHFAASALRLLPGYVTRYRQDRWLSRRELRAMAYVSAWHACLSRRDAAPGVTLFDHGPIFRLVRLRGFGPELVRGEAFGRWWRKTLAEWAPLLDVVVWLDAPDDALMQRIHSRPEWHRMKAEADRDLRRFLARYRECYEQVLSELGRIRAPRVLEFRTDLRSAEEIAEAVLRELDLGTGALRELPA